MKLLQNIKGSTQAIGVFAGLALAPAIPASAMPLTIEKSVKETFVEAAFIETGAAERLEAADRLRTLSQEVSSAACHLSNGILRQESRGLMIEAKVEFIRILDALEFGDPDMHIPAPETRGKTLADIHKLRAIWEPIETSILTMMEIPKDRASIKLIKDTNQELYDVSVHLLSELSGQYSDPVDLLQVDALLIDIAGRQSMLTQKIAKEACEVWTGNRSEERLASLKASVEMFNLGINALHDGYEPLGIKPAPTAEIKRSLELLVEDWEIVKADLDAVYAGDVTEEIKADLYHRLNKKMYKMNEVVHMYTVLAKHN